MYIPPIVRKKAKKARKIVKDSQRVVSRKHLNWVASHACSVESCATGTRIDPHHVKTRGAGGGDHFAIPLCRQHHDDLTKPNGGRWTFEREHSIDMFALAQHFASKSPVKAISDAAPSMVRAEEKPDMRRVS